MSTTVLPAFVQTTVTNTTTQPNPSLTTTTTQPAQSEASKVLGVLFILGTTAASIFIKNQNHVQTASTIINVLYELLPSIEGII